MGNTSNYILIYAPTPRGGLAEHIHYQASTLHEMNYKVIVLCTDDFLDNRAVKYIVKRSLITPSKVQGYKFLSKILLLASMIYNQYYFAFFSMRRKPSFILLESFTEYFSPLWIWPHILNYKILNYRYVANIHDPVRDFVLGPLWWHRLSISMAYLPIRFGLVHRRLPVPSPVPDHVKIAEVPVGVYDITESDIDANEMKSKWNFPNNAKIFLSFGYIRDNKNIDLFIKAQVKFSDAYLVVLGSEASSKGKPLEYYRNLAKEMGIANRTFFSNEFIPDLMIDSIFKSADYILLSYSSSFVSQSGVLNIGARLQKPVLASSGPSPLEDAIKKYNIGVFVQPDSVAALESGIDALISENFPTPDWNGYIAYASWKTNIDNLLSLINGSSN